MQVENLKELIGSRITLSKAELLDQSVAYASDSGRLEDARQ
ncbi:hypothetical protein [Novosphingobium album (ex Liu et al. 2023)]|uniref:Uncharacterized protein n=1 Tax=Novosphingobium album (ex Liu et al. 2023) TaxID=3031130 RepID=A0ABT5WTJ7_9SPHN|nr:hypothetical protein [Novosphingobium album (ex Liu et al. 2023)]MDE8653199.1 hypothetical protein [Novosphingobium album (ex Liu et al. 2023)]